MTDEKKPPRGNDKDRDKHRAWSSLTPQDDPVSRFDEFMKHVTIVSDDDAEQADMVVCMPDEGPRFFPDDIITSCAMCGITIKHRPHVPKTPPKVCVNCAAIMSGSDKPRA
jgi:hypothetical protein